MAITVEELEIVIRAKYADAIKDIETMAAKATHLAKEKLVPAQKQLDRAMNIGETTAQRTAKTQKNYIVQTADEIADVVSKSISAMKKQSTSAVAEMTEAQKAVLNMPKSSGKELPKSNAVPSPSTSTAKNTADTFDYTAQAATEAGQRIAAALEIADKKIDNLRRTMSLLKQQYDTLFAESGQSAKTLSLEKKMLSVQEELRKAVDKSIELGKALAEAEAPAENIIFQQTKMNMAEAEVFMTKNTKKEDVQEEVALVVLDLPPAES